MTATAGGRCRYCWRPSEIGGHNDGCPETGGAEAKAEWEAGYNYGYDDNYIPWYRHSYYSPSFILGWRAGKAYIDELVDYAAQRNADGL